jgi:hypothetical protein
MHLSMFITPCAVKTVTSGGRCTNFTVESPDGALLKISCRIRRDHGKASDECRKDEQENVGGNEGDIIEVHLDGTEFCTVSADQMK